MEKLSVMVSRPSNIAMIKYMGKTNFENNLPSNASLSYTLNHLQSYVRLTLQDSTKDEWKLLQSENLNLLALHLTEKAQARFLKHLAFLKNRFAVHASFLVESASNFPSDCGIASSASSFAALTAATIEMFQKMGVQQAYCSDGDMAALSAKGSGSSGRSFFSPWVLWSDETVRPLELSYDQLLHQVVVMDANVKKVSSSEAHQRVLTSPLFVGRVERAQLRLADFLEHMRQKNWKGLYQVAWDEFMDMHELFHTSEPAFSYFTEGSNKALALLKNYWEQHQDGPLITADAGPNIHLLWRKDQKQAMDLLEKDLQAHGKVLSSPS
jgi:diphosphomevalonate decarboxylase